VLLRAFIPLAALAIMPVTRAVAQPGATTIQLPTFGVAVDAAGVLSVKKFPDPGGRLHAKRVAAAKRALPANLAAWSDVRKISLRRLEAAARKRLDAGERLDETMQNLAGLQRLEYVFYFPDQRDIVVAGPAEGFVADASGRMVGIRSGRPVILFADLLTALRAFPPGGTNRPFVGCTIEPTPEGLARLKQFAGTIPRAVPQRGRSQAGSRIALGMAKALGMANVRVFGVPANTHFAQVLIEADYRMKLIGIGLERPPVRMVTFISSLKSVRDGGLQRWWFTPNYDCVKVTKDRTAMQLVGQGVQLQSEDKVIGADGRLMNATVPPNQATELFTGAFTKKYPQIAAASPVFTQLRNMIDLAIAAAFIREQDYYGRAGWDAKLLMDTLALPTGTVPTPKQAPCAVNSVWKGPRLFTPAGGGVSILPGEALNKRRLLPDNNGRLAEQYERATGKSTSDRWWWD